MLACVALALGFTLVPAHAEAQYAGLLVTPGPASPPMPQSPPPPTGGCPVPSLEECASSAYWSTNTCIAGKVNEAKRTAVQGYCKWAFQDEWRKGTGAKHPSMMPTTAPTDPDAIIKPALPRLRGQNVSGRAVAGRATKRRTYNRATAGNTGTAAMPSYEWTPKKLISTSGTYASELMAGITPTIAQVDTSLEPFRRTGLNVAEPQLATMAGSIFATLAVKPPYMSSPGATVSSCTEYAAKRWGDYSTFSFAAKKLGRNYRQIYNLATDPQSPYFINKSTLVQTGTSTPMPMQIPAVVPATLNPNAFYADKARFLDDYNNVPGLGPNEKAQIKSLIAARWTGGNNPKPKKITTSRTTPLGVHEDAKARLDTAYGNPTDDELEDASRRVSAYQRLVAQRISILERLECASGTDPCWLCRERPDPGGQQVPAVIAKVKNMISGAPVINPADVNVLLEVGNPAQRFRSLEVLQNLAPVVETLAPGLRGTQAMRDAAVQAGAKQKIDVAQLAQLSPTTPKAPPTTSPGGAGFNACSAALATQGQQLQIGLVGVERKMARMLLNELQVGARGCLANPGANATNLCDWGYDTFGSLMATLFDPSVENDARICRAEVINVQKYVQQAAAGSNQFLNALKFPKNQGAVYPCAWRQDFSVSAPQAATFMAMSGDQRGRRCEGHLQNQAVEQMQSAVAGELEGLEWNPDEKKVGDVEEDSVTLGEQSSLGAYASYKAYWQVQGTGTKPGGTVLDTCKFQGKAGSRFTTGIYFFGSDLKILHVDGKGETDGRKVTIDARYRDFEAFGMKPFSGQTDNKTHTYAQSDGVAIPLVNPPLYLGGEEVSFWVWIGPVPVNITFGATASAGIDYSFNGENGNNCSNMGQPSGFKLGSEAEPMARGDAYADAAVDIGVASAGIRLDLLLLRLGFPIGVSVGTATDAGKSVWKFNNGAKVSVDLLSGKVTAYAEAGVSPLEATWEETLFRWDGFHVDVNVFGASKTIDNDVMRVALAQKIDPDKAKCVCDPTILPTFVGRCCSELQCLAPGCTNGVPIEGQSRLCKFKTVTGHPECNAYVQ